MNKELEEAAQEYKDRAGDIPSTELEQEISKLGFINGAEWQAERMFSRQQMMFFAGYAHGAVEKDHTVDMTEVFEDFLKLKHLIP